MLDYYAQERILSDADAFMPSVEAVLVVLFPSAKMETVVVTAYL